MGVREALDLLGVPAEADASALKGAFTAAVRSAHPDRAGGDGQRLRLVIEAYRMLEPKPPAGLSPRAAKAPIETSTEAKRRRFVAVWAA